MKVVAALCFISVALAADVPSYSKPEYTTPAYTKQYDYAPMPYNFAWAVKDVPSYNDFTHQESSDGKVVSGSYKVLLPDGRLQIVTYKADDYGYVADVQYQGEAKYEYKPSSYPALAAYPKSSYSSPAYTTPAAYPKEAYPSSPTYPQPSYTTPTYTPVAYKKAEY